MLYIIICLCLLFFGSINAFDGFDVYGYDVNLTKICNTQLSCHNYETCRDSFDFFTEMCNSTYTCYFPDDDIQTCYLFGNSKEENFQSVAVTTDLIPLHRYGPDKFYINFIEQCMNYYEYFYISGFCIKK